MHYESRKKLYSSALVTGASGFIGQHLVDRLTRDGVKVNALVRSRNKSKLSGDMNVFEGDIFNKRILKKAVDNVEVVFHLVAKTHHLLDGNRHGEDYFIVNVDGTRNLLNACMDSSIKHFIYFSSVKAMTEHSEGVLDEFFVPEPETPYGESKLLTERIVADYGRKYGFKTTSIRLPLVYGPGNKGNIYKMIEAIDRGRFIMIGRGANKRSMVYVGNVVDAALKVACNEDANDKIYIVTDGVDYTLNDLYKIISNGLRRKPRRFSLPLGIAKGLALAGDIGGRIVGNTLPFNSESLRKLTTSLTFSSCRIQDEVGFHPRYNLYNTINKTICWYRDMNNILRNA